MNLAMMLAPALKVQLKKMTDEQKKATMRAIYTFSRALLAGDLKTAADVLTLMGVDSDLVTAIIDGFTFVDESGVLWSELEMDPGTDGNQV